MKKSASLFRFTYYLFTTLVILVIGAYLIIIANGYKINFAAKKIQKTGLISINSDPHDVSVYLNNKLFSSKTPTRIIDLFSGRYDIKISKSDYQDWEKTIFVDTGYVSLQDDIVLFLQNPKNLPITQAEIDSFNKLPNTLINSDLEIRNGSEIWINTLQNDSILVTRLSKPIKKVAYYSDKNHILYQVGNEINILDADGSNNKTLVHLTSDQNSDFFVNTGGDTLFYRDGQDIKKVLIH